MIRLNEFFEKLNAFRGSTKAIIVVLLFIGINIMAMRHILLIGAFQDSDLGTGWFGIGEISRLFSPWNFYNLGTINGPSGFYFISSYFSILLGPGGSEKVIYYLSVFVAPFGSYILCRKLKIGYVVSILFAALFQLNPWFIGQFMTGEPGFTWLYALIPFNIYFIYSIFKVPKKISGYAGLALALSISIMFTLQSIIVYAFILSPMIIAFLYDSRNPNRLLSTLGMVFATLISIAANIYSIGPYIVAESTLSSSASNNSNVLFGAFASSTAIDLRIWIFLLMIFSLLVSLFLYKKLNNPKKIFLLATLVFQAFFTSIYFLIPSHAIAYFYIHFPVFSPFQNYDKFMLVSTFFLTSILIIYAIEGNGKRQSLSGKKLNEQKRQMIFKSDKMKIFKFATVLITIGLMVSTSLFASIQPINQGATGINYLQGNISFPNHQVPASYYELRNFLLAQNVNFSLSPHVLVVPQNPGNILPFYVGSAMIPGYIGPSLTLENVIKEIAVNNTMATYLMSLLGIKYVAIMNDPGDSGWPGANGNPSLGSWGGGYFPQGNISHYTKILESWSSLLPVFKSKNLTILYNSEYVGSAYYYGQKMYLYNGGPYGNVSVSNIIDNLTKGNYYELFNTSPIGNNIISDPNLTNPSAWNFNSGNGNANLSNNGTVELRPGSTGASLRQNITLRSSMHPPLEPFYCVCKAFLYVMFRFP